MRVVPHALINSNSMMTTCPECGGEFKEKYDSNGEPTTYYYQYHYVSSHVDLPTELPEVGLKIRIAFPVERYPYFTAREGLTGTVVESDKTMIAIELDEILKEAKEWNNEIHWYPNMPEVERIREFWVDCEVIV